MPSRSSSLLTHARDIVILAVGYLLAARAGMALAIPPGYVTAIFPASGVALAALLLWGGRLWPGVFFGSFALNLWITLDAGRELAPPVLAVAAGIGFGAVLQALFGAWLIRRFIGFPTALSDDREVLRFLGLGVAGCLTSGSVGVLVLWLAGAVSGVNLLFSWWTWVVGDALGVLLGTPVLLTFFATPKRLWRARRWSVALPMVVVALGIIPAFMGASHWESQRGVLEFRKQAELLHQTLESKIQLNLDAIHALRDYYLGVEQITFQGFSQFANGTLSRHHSIHALSFNPLVTFAERAAFEAAIRQEVDPGFAIRERHPDKGLMAAEERPEYVTVAYIQPLAANRNALGFDVASNPARKAALDRARDSGKPVATSRITLVQETQNQSGVLAFLPVYADTAGTPEERRARLKGFTVGVFRIGDLLASALIGVNREELSATLYEEGDGSERMFLAGFGDGRGVWDGEPAAAAGAGHPDPWWSQPLDFGGQRWRLELTPTRSALEAQRSWGAWFVLAGGLLFASLLGAFLLINTGRTARIEELVAKRTSQLAERESRLKAILDNAGDGIITINQDGIIESANPAAARLFDYEMAEMAGRNVSMLMPPPYRDNHDAFIRRYLETGEARVVGGSREVTGVRKDGALVPIDLSVSAVQLEEGQLFTGILRDLTERKRVELLKSEFVSTVSHELRTPLTSIYGGLKMVLAGVTGELPDKARRLLDLAYSNSERLNLLINDILDIQKMEAGRLEFHFAPLDAAGLVRKAVAENAAYAQKFGVRFVIVEPLPEGLTVNGDEGRLCQVLANFLSNAAKFSESGASVEIRVVPTRPWVEFSVSDHGPGIPEAFQPKVFEKFSQADASDARKKGGTGLGLAITRSLVESHHGEIGFHSTPGEGATFFFRLPERAG